MKARFFELTESRQWGYTPTPMAFDWVFSFCSFPPSLLWYPLIKGPQVTWLYTHLDRRLVSDLHLNAHLMFFQYHFSTIQLGRQVSKNFLVLTLIHTSCVSRASRLVLWSHFVWINQMCWTVVDSKQLGWLEMGSFKHACMLHGYLTHTSTLDKSLVVGHFVSKATFKVANQNSTNRWVHPSPPAKPFQDDPMEGLPKKPSSPGRDFTLPNRTGVTLEEQVEGTLPHRYFRGGKHHKKKKPKVD